MCWAFADTLQPWSSQRPRTYRAYYHPLHRGETSCPKSDPTQRDSGHKLFPLFAVCTVPWLQVRSKMTVVVMMMMIKPVLLRVCICQALYWYLLYCALHLSQEPYKRDTVLPYLTEKHDLLIWSWVSIYQWQSRDEPMSCFPVWPLRSTVFNPWLWALYFLAVLLKI